MREIKSRLSLFFLILFLPLVSFGAECTTFTDIGSSSYKQDILDASNKGWITCRDVFNPSQQISRAEALGVSLSADNRTIPAVTTSCFSDVITDWQINDTCYAKREGLIADNPTFRPNEDINFVEASKMILKTLTNDDYTANVGDVWYTKYLEKMALYGFNLNPTDTIDRDYFIHIVKTIEADNVDKNPNPLTCEAYGSYEAIDKAVKNNSVVSGSLWLASNEEYGYNYPYDQIYLDADDSLPDYHSGIDISIPYDTPIYALADGEVVKIKASIGAVYIRLLNQKGTLVYMHLSDYSTLKVGDKVYAKTDTAEPTLIGKTGNVGTNGYHLHFAWLQDESDNPIEIWSGNWNNDITSVTYDPKNLKNCGDTNQPIDTTSDSELYGIDVSKHNTYHGGNVKWKELRDEKNIKFVFIKSTEGFPDNNYDDDLTNDLNKSEEITASYLDEEFEIHIKGALDNNLIVAPYHFIRPDYNNALEDANKSVKYFISKIKSYYVDSNNKMLPPVIDVENPPSDKENVNNKGQIAKWTKAEFTNWLLIFAESIKKEIGVYPIFYMNENFANNEVNILDLNAKSSALWIAKFKCSAIDLTVSTNSLCYNSPQLEPYNKPIINDAISYKFWQFTETSTEYTNYMDSDYADVNIFYGTISDLEALLVNGKSSYKVGNFQEIPSNLTAKIEPIIDSIDKIKQSVSDILNPNYFGIYSFNPSILTAQNEQQTLDIYGNGFTVDSQVLWDDGEGSNGIIPKENTQNILPTHIQIKLTTLSTGVGTWTFKVQNDNTVSDAKAVTVKDISVSLDDATAYKNFIGVKTLPAGGVYIPDGIGWYRGECTSYVGYKVKVNGISSFTNWYKGAHFGDAKLWADAAKKIGWTVSDTPKVGAIGYWTSGKHGHVVYIDNVNSDGTVNISEYNVHLRHEFNKATNVSADKYNYIYPPYPTSTTRMARIIDSNNTEEDMKIGLLLLEVDRLTLFINELNYEIVNIQDQNLSDQLNNELEKAYDILKTLEDLILNRSYTLEEIQNDILSQLDLLKSFFIETSIPIYTTKDSIQVPKGRSLISGNIDVTKLPSEIYAVWIVDGGNWYGYSPDESVREAIKSKYRLIDQIIPAYKAVIVWANSDASIELEDDKSIDNVTQSYGKNFTIHGANNQTFSVDDVVCSDTNNSITGLFKVSGDMPSVFVPNKEINSTENFTYIYSDEGYYVLCEKRQGGSL